MSWTFTLPFATPSLNEIQGQHWSYARREKESLRWSLASALNHIPAIPKAAGRRRLTIVRHGRGRLDQDNLAGGVKWLVDAIKERRLILDDNPEECELVCQQVVSRTADPHTILTLEDDPTDTRNFACHEDYVAANFRREAS